MHNRSYIVPMICLYFILYNKRVVPSESTKTITELLSSLSICFEDKFVREKCMNEQLVFQ